MSEKVVSEEVIANGGLDHVVADEPELVEVEMDSWVDDQESDSPLVLDSKVEQNRTETGDKPIMEEKFIELEVSEIIVPEESNVRPITADNPSEKEQESIDALANSIALHGQLQPVRVMEKVSDDGAVTYHLIMGRRRLQAIASLAVPRKVRAVVVGEQDSQATFEQALAENIQREDINPIDMLENIKRTREQFKLKGAKNTPKVAAMFGVSPAKIHTYEQLDGLDSATKEKVRQGEVSREGAFLLVGRVNAPEIVEKARVIQATELRGRPGKARVNVDSKSEGKVKPVAVKARAIKKAIREVDSNTPMTRSRKEILDWFESMKGPVYGHSDGAPHQFIDGVIAFSEGKIGDRALEKRWAECVARAFKGTAPKSENKKSDSEVKVKAKVRNKK